MTLLTSIDIDVAGVSAQLEGRDAWRDDRGCHVLNPHFRAKAPLTPAAVLVPLIDHADGPTVLLTRRTDDLKDHPGQISFPGGRVEQADTDAVETALRETEEEIGLARDKVEVIGRLDTYLTATGFSVTPIVGRIEPPFETAPDPTEVAEIFEVPLAFLLDPLNHQREERWFGDLRWFAYAMPYNQYRIWGITAGMIRNFYEILLGVSTIEASDAQSGDAS